MNRQYRLCNAHGNPTLFTVDESAKEEVKSLMGWSEADWNLYAKEVRE